MILTAMVRGQIAGGQSWKGHYQQINVFNSFKEGDALCEQMVAFPYRYSVTINKGNIVL